MARQKLRDPRIPHAVEGLMLEEFNTDTVVLSSDHVFLLQGIASCIFDLCDGEHTVGEIADIISKTLKVSFNRVFKDVRETLDEMARFGLISFK